MEIKIKKRQETIDDIAEEPTYDIIVTESYGSGEFKTHNSQGLYVLSTEDVKALRDRLNKDFPH